ncbi:MAG: hypothetical protein AB7J30_12635 [Hyphomicrobium sp.]|uniref:hypothetical protein n=1 Tax=Hyphomicrobium sp. TaxID=82 RepID=UPI003D0AB85D
MPDTTPTNVIAIEDDELIPDAQLAEQWGTVTRTLNSYDRASPGLPFVKIGKRKYRPVKACRAWLAARIKQPNPPRRRGRR